MPITWRYVACSYPSMKLYFKEGSSQWWTAVQVREHRYPIKSLAWRASGSGAAYVTLPREPYNYFLAASGMGPGPYDIRHHRCERSGHRGNVSAASPSRRRSTSASSSPRSVRLLHRRRPCADGADNDGDGRVDYPADPGCSALDDNDETDTAPPPATQPQVAQTISNDWGSGCCANVRATNPGTQPLTWRINFSIQEAYAPRGTSCCHRAGPS